MVDRFFGPADIEKATAGEVSQTDLRNYVRDGRFNTRMKEPRAGKPRELPIFAVYEAALLKKFSSCGVPLDKAKLWNKEILDRIAKHRVAWVSQETGSQSGPGGPFSGVLQTVLFNRDCERPLMLTDSEGGETLNRAFYILRRFSEKKPGPAETIAAIHLPALISKINHVLGVTHEDAGIA